MNVCLDLHVHTKASHDGRMDMDKIISRARSAGLQGVALCDHDVFCSELPAFTDFLLIPGVEFSTKYGHLLGLFVEKPFEPGTFEQLIESIHAQGGLAVLAHPFQHHREEARLAPIVHLLDGVEVWNSRANRKIGDANARAQAFANRHGLLFFAGSDAHVPEEVGAGFVELDCASLTLNAVKEALLQKGGRVRGRGSPARHAARSQLTKLRKKGAAAPAYGKWLLFAARCLAQDLCHRKGEDHVFDR